eukprot:11194090-Alexandrium_andersonii.AAC.1
MTTSAEAPLEVSSSVDPDAAESSATAVNSASTSAPESAAINSGIQAGFGQDGGLRSGQPEDPTASQLSMHADVATQTEKDWRTLTWSEMWEDYREE